MKTLHGVTSVSFAGGAGVNISEILPGGLEISVETDQVDVTPSREPDPEWSVLDSAGHEHRWAFDGERADLPTLLLVVDAEATEEYPALTHHECRQCGAIVHPGFRSPQFRRYAAGLTRYYVNGRQVSQQEAEAARKGLATSPPTPPPAPAP